MSIVNGTRIGPYEVVGWLGAGGMGDVYRARDERLGRDVAIKVIAETRAEDERRVSRFEQEARAAGQLNHPNILAVHDIGVYQNSPFIVSELLEGESLRSRLSNGALSVKKAVEYARQIADGLSAAHDKNIVHRDIKPDNLFITNGGRIKILDFGIAKLTRPADEGPGTGLATATAEGAVIGTAGYMSPEQIRGGEVDARSDIFSAGTVLYEMLSGQAAFVRGTAADTMSAVLKDDPAATLSKTLTPALERIVARCLEKSCEMRFQSARDLAFALDVLSDTGIRPAARDDAAPSNRWARRTAVGAAAVVIAAVVAAIFWFAPSRVPTAIQNPLADARFSRVTDWPGTEAGAQMSPDGKFVAFVADRDGQTNLFLNQLGTDNYSNLTSHLPPLSAPNAILTTLGFSGNSGEVWFTQAGDSSAPKWLIPLTGGTPRPFLGQGAATPSWSPDGSRLVYFINNGGDPIYLADSKGANAQPLNVDQPDFFASGVHSHNPIWSPDGQWIYFAHGLDPIEEMNIWRVRPTGGRAEQLTTLHTGVNFITAIDNRTLLFIARADDRSGPWLWSLDIDTRETTRVTSGLEHYSSISASRDGRRVVATVTNPTATLWSVPILDRKAEDADVRKYPQTSAKAFGPRFGKDGLFYLSDRGAGDGLWFTTNGQASEIWKPEGGDALTEPIAVSPDGRRLALVIRRDRKLRVSVMAADGTDARTLAPEIDIHGSGGRGGIDWSPDGRWIVVTGSDAQGSGVFKIPVDGGPTVRLVTGDAVNPIWSPLGDLIVYGGAVVAGRLPLLGVKPDKTPVKLPNVEARLGGGHRFLRNGNLVYLPRGQSLDFWLLDLKTNTMRTLTQLGDQGSLNTFDIAPDGQSIVFDRTQEHSDISLIDLPLKADR